MKNPLKIIWIILGFLCLGLGTIGIVLPILPTIPFYVATTFCFAKSSKQLHEWFATTKLYKNNLESFINKRGMTIKTKWSIVSIVAVMILIGFFLLSKVMIGRIILITIWIGHLYYFFIHVKTLPVEKNELEVKIEHFNIKDASKEHR